MLERIPGKNQILFRFEIRCMALKRAHGKNHMSFHFGICCLAFERAHGKNHILYFHLLKMVDGMAGVTTSPPIFSPYIRARLLKPICSEVVH